MFVIIIADMAGFVMNVCCCKDVPIRMSLMLGVRPEVMASIIMRV